MTLTVLEPCSENFAVLYSDHIVTCTSRLVPLLALAPRGQGEVIECLSQWTVDMCFKLWPLRPAYIQIVWISLHICFKKYYSIYVVCLSGYKNRWTKTINSTYATARTVPTRCLREKFMDITRLPTQFMYLIGCSWILSPWYFSQSGMWCSPVAILLI